MRIADVISSAQFDGVNLERCEFLENQTEWQLRQQGSEDSNAHNGVLSLN
jgi:hypothetical protein